ncbi:hypothetical protein EVAR_53824_1 [Eumeta japonica]|uniref:Uncharacterized protein n=1 Tax=Eumeta variegata TaxID=151549 RepID=A0A4C1YPW8_EUMVA|nr:hypothetical protein EVAR_53824_1 [Eumeta japonica]
MPDCFKNIKLYRVQSRLGNRPHNGGAARGPGAVARCLSTVSIKLTFQVNEIPRRLAGNAAKAKFSARRNGPVTMHRGRANARDSRR